jgi:hypothetical protein
LIARTSNVRDLSIGTKKIQRTSKSPSPRLEPSPSSLPLVNKTYWANWPLLPTFTSRRSPTRPNVSLCLTSGMGEGGFVGYIWGGEGGGVAGK